MEPSVHLNTRSWYQVKFPKDRILQNRHSTIPAAMGAEEIMTVGIIPDKKKALLFDNTFYLVPAIHSVILLSSSWSTAPIEYYFFECRF